MKETNGIQWYEWDHAAFQLAGELDRPIFLYLYTPYGHAVRVFESEVLARTDVAKLLNERTLPVRVDSLERPDVFERYNQGGWPSLCLLTPTGELLHGRSRMDAEQLIATVNQVADYYRTHGEEIRRKVEQAGPPDMPRFEAADPPREPDPDRLEGILREAEAFYDHRFAGFGRAPKFPLPELLLLLIEDPKEERRALALRTLERISESALQDHLGGGFFRYCDDEGWRFPNLEKLLFENASLLEVYLASYRLTGREEFAAVARRTMSYLERVLGDPESGLFYSGQAADGAFDGRGDVYGWTEEEIRAVTEEAEAQAFLIRYGISPEAALPGGGQRSIPEERSPVRQVAMRLGISEEEAESRLERARDSLLRQREQRPQPQVDDRLFTASNARLLGPLALTAMQLERPRLLQRAFEAADILWESAHRDTGGVEPVAGERADSLYLTDQVEVILGFLALYNAAGRAKDWVRAETLAHETFDLFVEGAGGYDHLMREEEQGMLRYLYMPFEANSRLLQATAQLALLTEEPEWRERSLLLADGMSAYAGVHRLRNASYGRGLRMLLQPPAVIDLITGEDAGRKRRILLSRAPVRTLIRAFDPDQKTPWTRLERYPSNGSRARMVVHHGERELGPTDDPEEVLRFLAEGK